MHAVSAFYLDDFDVPPGGFEQVGSAFGVVERVEDALRY
jgi:hypothetical protein